MNENGQQPPRLEIDVQLAQSIIDYLTQQPYREVAHLIAGLSQLQPSAASSAPVMETTREET